MKKNIILAMALFLTANTVFAAEIYNESSGMDLTSAGSPNQDLSVQFNLALNSNIEVKVANKAMVATGADGVIDLGTISGNLQSASDCDDLGSGFALRSANIDQMKVEEVATAGSLNETYAEQVAECRVVNGGPADVRVQMRIPLAVSYLKTGSDAGSIAYFFSASDFTNAKVCDLSGTASNNQLNNIFSGSSTCSNASTTILAASTQASEQKFVALEAKLLGPGSVGSSVAATLDIDVILE